MKESKKLLTKRKWIHCFDNVSAVIFVTSLSEYDLRCYEDDSTLRMKESLILFEEICNSRYFSEIPIVLFFNKVDLFKEKIKNVDLNVCFKDYQGGKDYDKAIKYIIQTFLDKNQDDQKVINTYCTCATDTSNIKDAFQGVTSLNFGKNKK
jgi:guanine nucleotide-binding protein G(i) subunit alpha